MAEHVFTIIFILELCWRVYRQRLSYFKELLNIIDAFLAVYSFIYVYVIAPRSPPVNESCSSVGL